MDSKAYVHAQYGSNCFFCSIEHADEQLLLNKESRQKELQNMISNGHLRVTDMVKTFTQTVFPVKRSMGNKHAISVFPLMTRSNVTYFDKQMYLSYYRSEDIFFSLTKIVMEGVLYIIPVVSYLCIQMYFWLQICIFLPIHFHLT